MDNTITQHLKKLTITPRSDDWYKQVAQKIGRPAGSGGRAKVAVRDFISEGQKKASNDNHEMLDRQVQEEAKQQQGKGSADQFITVYEHADFQGRSRNIPIGQFKVLPSGVKNDSISSARIPSGLKATFYEHGGFQGRPRVYTSDIANFGDFNDATSSIKVEPSSLVDKFIPDKRIDFEKYVPPEITQQVRGAVQDKMREETPGVVRWTGIHKSEMAKDKARERIRDMLPNRLEDKGIEDFLVGRKPIGTGVTGTTHRKVVGYLYDPAVYTMRQAEQHARQFHGEIGRPRKVGGFLTKILVPVKPLIKNLGIVARQAGKGLTVLSVDRGNSI